MAVSRGPGCQGGHSFIAKMARYGAGQRSILVKKQGRPRWPEAKLDAGCLGDRLCLYNRDGIDAVQRHAHPSTCQAQFSSLEAWPIAFRIYLAHCP